VVWDKAVEAHYKRPAKSTISGEFIFSSEDITNIKQSVAENNETAIVKTLNLVDENQNIIATFNKTVYIADKGFYKEKLKNLNRKPKYNTNEIT
jgi:hypothetical protein